MAYVTAYITGDDVVARFGDKVLAWAGGDTGVVAAACVSATAEIDGYVASGGYSLPLASTPEIVKVHACSIVAYRLLVRAGFLPDTVDAGQNPIAKGYEHAVHWLEQVASGALKIMVRDAKPGPALTPKEKRSSAMVRAPEKMDLGGFV